MWRNLSKFITLTGLYRSKQLETLEFRNFRVKGKKLYFGFVDLEKAYDTVPREVIQWAMRKLGVEEWLVSAVMSMYTGAKTVVEQFMVIVAVLR